MNILCIGDIVGRPGRNAVKDLLAGIAAEFEIDFVIANAENAAGGCDHRIANEIFDMGCHFITLGDHVWDKLGSRNIWRKQIIWCVRLIFRKARPGGDGLWLKHPQAKIGVISLWDGFLCGIMSIVRFALCKPPLKR